MSKKSVKSYIKSDDYFGTVATIVSLVGQLPQNIKQSAKMLSKVKKDLIFLQSEYKIVQK